ncbi:MAG TPA: NUDIX domain-containing protein [Intrasporangium sp.]|uniref:NUDIX hydrolase n=1 Tax=Intrasporangium sp. TaxID=1925024 RepID=UPI002D77F754|nr:NUDIX domain-containing protein [Intrasporangium sp.]HET7399620.1 NUDIX domain-containing protein [Intrasporangium sp.]
MTPAEAPRAAGCGRVDEAAAYARLHADARALLEAWGAPGPRQAALRDGMLAHLASHPDAMAKTGPPAHFTGSVLVLDHTLAAVLLTHHRRARAWFQFGGHYEPGDSSVWAAARREGREESGIPDLAVRPEIVHLDRHRLVGDFGRCREHLDIRFAAVAPDGVDPSVSDESIDVRWWPVDGLPEDTRDELLPLVTAARSALAG